ncbi:MAG: GNAT family N-acetyltransferase [Pseudomonadota bacterium]
MTLSYILRLGEPADEARLLALIPQLADFDVPNNRDPRTLWASDAELLRRCLVGDAPQSFVQVAVSDDGILGFTLTTLRPELLSHAPSAHLEAIVVAAAARGLGLGRELLAHAESEALARGALSITLHAFGTNARARALYESAGYDPELIRYSKPLSTD